MKKVLSVIAIAAVSAAFVSCGPSQADLDAAAKKTADSLAAIATADSLARVAEEMATNAVDTTAVDSTQATMTEEAK